MQIRPDWKSRVVTIALLIIGAFITGGALASAIDRGPWPWWLLVIACVVFVAAYVGVRRVAEQVSGTRGYLLDLVMSIPMGLLFMTKERVLPITDAGWTMFVNGVFIGFLFLVGSAYFYQRHPRNSDAAVPADEGLGTK